MSSAVHSKRVSGLALTKCQRRSSSLQEFGFIAHLLRFLRVWVYRPALAKVDFDALALCQRALKVLAWREGVVSLASGAYGLARWFETVSLALCAFGLVSLVFFLSHVKGE